MKNFIIAASPRVVLGWMQKNTKKESLMSAARRQNRTGPDRAACIGSGQSARSSGSPSSSPPASRASWTVGDESYASSIEASGNSRYVAEGIVDIPSGQNLQNRWIDLV